MGIDNEIKNITQQMAAKEIIVNTYNQRMRSTQGGEKIAGLWMPGSCVSFVAEKGKYCLDQFVSTKPESQLAQIPWALSAGLLGTPAGLILATCLAWGGLADSVISIGNLFTPYEGEIKAKDASKEWRVLNKKREILLKERRK